MALFNFERIKESITERIEANYNKSFEFYHGFIVAFFLEDAINMKEKKKLQDWLCTLDLK